jgi:hypothetical protein
MFNLARIKVRFKSEVRAAKQFFKRQTEHEKAREEKITMDAPEPSRRSMERSPGHISRRRSTRIPKILAMKNDLVRRHYFSGQFRPMKNLTFLGREVRFSWQDIVRARRNYAA